MSPEERDLIEGVFERMRSVGSIDKDRDAEALINTGVRQIRDSAYMLVQTVIVQDQALQQAEDRIRDLEDQVQQLQEASRQPVQKPASGGFLGGIFGGGAKPAADSSPWGDSRGSGGSVPSVGRQSAGYSGPAAQRSPWGGASAPQPQSTGFGQPPQAAPQSGSGGFMRSAMATAAGVAGGVLVAGAIGNMMRGDSSGGGHQSASHDGSSQPDYQDASSNDQGGTYSSEPQYQDAASNDQGNVHDTGYDDGGSDWGSVDIDT